MWAKKIWQTCSPNISAWPADYASPRLENLLAVCWKIEVQNPLFLRKLYSYLSLLGFFEPKSNLYPFWNSQHPIIPSSVHTNSTSSFNLRTLEISNKKMFFDAYWNEQMSPIIRLKLDVIFIEATCKFFFIKSIENFEIISVRSCISCYRLECVKQ